MLAAEGSKAEKFHWWMEPFQTRQPELRRLQAIE